MSADFFRFPHTPHILWLGEGQPRGDKLLPEAESRVMLENKLTIEEKVDGANVGFSVGNDGMLRAQNRGAWIERDAGGQFKHLWKWVKPFEEDLVSLLEPGLILFGEWCYAQHSLAYQQLPDWFIGFDIYDRHTKHFFSVKKRDEYLSLLRLTPVTTLAAGSFSLHELQQLLDQPSTYGSGRLEGIYLRQDQGQWLKRRAKLVRCDFTQAIGEHWSRKAIIPNQIIFETGT